MNELNIIKRNAQIIRSGLYRKDYRAPSAPQYRIAPSMPIWARRICEECYITAYEDTITNRFIVEVLDKIINLKTEAGVDTIHHKIGHDLTVEQLLQWFAQTPRHIDLFDNARDTLHENMIARRAKIRGATKPARTYADCEKILKHAQKTRKREIAKQIIKSLRAHIKIQKAISTS